MSESQSIGYYGKLPSHGDFVTRGLSPSFVDAWDAWLQSSIVRSRDLLGESWLDYFLTSPVWRFILDAGAIDERAYAGILFPSVDRVGRYFPMTAARRLPGTFRFDVDSFESLEPWLSASETELLAALERDENDLDAIARSIESVGSAEPAPGLVAGPMFPVTRLQNFSSFRVGLGSTRSPGSGLADALISGLAGSISPMTIWWSRGVAEGGRSLVAARGLPEPSLFAEMLTGFQSTGGQEADPAVLEPGAGMGLVPGLVHRASSATTPGRVRSNNEDSFIARTADGVWVVSDGIGGQSHGELASRMVTDAVAAVDLSGGLDVRSERIRRALADVNAELRRMARERPDDFNAGATVVVLVAYGTNGTLIWAGDSRAYRLRGGQLELLTSDHVEAASEEFEGRSHVITRAVGGSDRLEADFCAIELVAGDRILLCSDGVHGEISPEILRTSIDGAWSEKLAPNLLDRVLEGRAPDNATAIVVDFEKPAQG